MSRVVGLRRQSTQGEFLDGDELATLIHGLQRLTFANVSPRLQQFLQTDAQDAIALARDRAREALKQVQQTHATVVTLWRVLQATLPDECARLGGGHLVQEEDDL
ncbi:hypothetical protein C2857_007414 [Epichloe festucae Fl1]|uniref:Uncharacterized protein n=1 Tax=Epichloe festucae (strain Fl1) TaxID=877507 RepID=A0A7S9KQT6_EPIFF|nr:hypothetical protein C2857_007414 [Epichloe festucae Fl1]